MEIIKVDGNKKQYMELLLLADPSEEMIDRYLEAGDMFVINDCEKAVCEAVVVKISETACELKNIATLPSFQNRNYASRMIRFLFEYYKDKFKEIFVGTAETGGMFYLKQGFEYSHVVPDFFINNYPEPVIDNGVQCKDMVYYKRTLSR